MLLKMEREPWQSNKNKKRNQLLINWLESMHIPMTCDDFDFDRFRTREFFRLPFPARWWFPEDKLPLPRFDSSRVLFVCMCDNSSAEDVEDMLRCRFPYTDFEVVVVETSQMSLYRWSSSSSSSSLEVPGRSWVNWRKNKDSLKYLFR